MDHLPETRHSLLLRIRDAEDARAWSEFLEIYRPMIYRVARFRGWQDADSQDLAQVVLTKVASKIDSFDPEGDAKFRTWLRRVCQNAITDELRRRRPEASLIGATDIDSVCVDRDFDESEFATEQRRAIFRWAAKQVANEFEVMSWEAFRRTAIDGEPAKAVAADLELSVGAVYTARSRVMRRLKEKVREHDDM